jgi:hypothetical protein
MEHHAYILTTKINLWNFWFNCWMQLNQTRNQCVVVTICRKWWETLGMLIFWYFVKILVEEISEFFSWNSKNKLCLWITTTCCSVNVFLKSDIYIYKGSHSLYFLMEHKNRGVFLGMLWHNKIFQVNIFLKYFHNPILSTSVFAKKFQFF